MVLTQFFFAKLGKMTQITHKNTKDADTVQGVKSHSLEQWVTEWYRIDESKLSFKNNRQRKLRHFTTSKMQLL